MRESFYLPLPSNSSFDYYPGNKTGDYTVKLPRHIELEGDGWEVGLAEIHFPMSFVRPETDQGQLPENVSPAATSGNRAKRQTRRVAPPVHPKMFENKSWVMFHWKAHRNIGSTLPSNFPVDVAQKEEERISHSPSEHGYSDREIWQTWQKYKLGGLDKLPFAFPQHTAREMDERMERQIDLVLARVRARDRATKVSEIEE